jgi:hypothetical protein
MQLPSGQRDKYQGINLPIPAVRATAHGVTVFANAINLQRKAQSCTAPRVQKHAPPRLCGNRHIPPAVSCKRKSRNNYSLSLRISK